jgi:peptide/nickel transport system permease protein
MAVLSHAARLLPGRLGRVRRRMGATPIALVAAFVLALFFLAAVFGPFLTASPNAQDLVASYKHPYGWSGGSVHHLFGTDQLGRDVLARSVNALRTSFLTSGLAIVIAAVAGTCLGMLAGYAGGIVDEVLMRIVDIQLAIPGIILVLMLVAALRPSFWSVVGVLALVAWVLYARVARAQVLGLRDDDMVVAIRSLGASRLRILFRHLLPNIAGPLLVVSTLEIANLIIAEAALGYLGLGVPPPTATLGRMISDGQTGETAGIWWPVVVPGLLIVGLILAINVIGEWLRDRLDPRGSASAGGDDVR